MPKTYDCFQFFNELDILEIRLNELDSEVDHFVIVEAEASHQYKKKPLFFHENKSRFEKFLDKIIHVIVPISDFKSNDFWYNENLQRKMLLKGIEKAENEDFIMISDADEIISNTALNSVKNNFTENAYIFSQNLYMWYLNTRVNSYEWINAGICRKKYLETIGTQSFKKNTSCASFPRIQNGGWHFSYLGDHEKIKTKLENFAHAEFAHLSIDDLKKNREKLIDPLGRTNEGINLIEDSIETLPIYVQQNFQKFKTHIKEKS
jgi:beta-1,4-mannosyl-glycoprotein beta-1,4-N-acetylglucosaminyltransferase